MNNASQKAELKEPNTNAASNAPSTNFLEPVLGAGLPGGSSICLIGPPGAGKTIFCESLANSFLQNNLGCLYVAMDRAPIDTRNDFLRFGTDSWKLESEKRLAFVDGYGWLAGTSDESFHVESLANLSELIILIERATDSLHKQAEGALVILDSVSPLPLYNPELDVIKFLQSLSARIKIRNDLAIYVVQSGVHAKEFYNALAFLVDGVFEMKVNEEEGRLKRSFRIRNLRFMAHDMEWMHFVIDGEGGFRFQNAKTTANHES
jgi:KaiC/GvpD/RAD55 family RecA-like ATPase